MILFVLGGLVVAALGFVGWLYGASEAQMRRYPKPPAFVAETPTDPATLAHGAVLATRLGCAGCHGEDFGGDAMGGDLLNGKTYPANLTTFVRAHDIAAFEAAVRHGIDPKGRGYWSMPSTGFVHVTDADIAALYGYISSLPVSPKKTPRSTLGPMPRIAVAMGEDGPVPKYIPLMQPLAHATGDAQLQRGEYLAMTACSECHGPTLSGDNPWDGPDGPPDLMIAASYGEADFRTLMRDGKGVGDRELRLMSGVARARFKGMSDAEIADLHAYLKDRAQKKLDAAR